MSAARTWSIKGVDESLREAAKRVAHSRGQTLGELINELIRKEAGGIGETGGDGDAAGKDRDFVMRRLDELGEQIRTLVRRDQETAVNRVMQAPDDGALREIVTRVENNERQAARALAEIERRLEDLSQRLQESLSAAKDEPAAAGHEELETALRNVMQHLELFERRSSATFDEFRERLDEVAAQAREALRIASEAAAGAGGRDDDQVEALRERVESLAGRLGDLGRQAEARARDYVDRNLAAIGERVEVVQRLSQELPGRVEGLVTEVTGRHLGQVERRIEETVGRLREKLENLTGGVLDVDRIGKKVESLGEKIDELGRTAARRDEVTAIKSALEKLSVVVDEKADRDEVNGLAARLDDMMARLDKERAALADDPAFRRLDDRVREIEEELRSATESMAGRDAVAHLEKTMGAVEERLQQAEAQLAYLPQLENSVARLFQSLEATNEETRRIVEETARHVIAEQQSASGGDGAAFADDERARRELDEVREQIDALRSGLEAVRMAARDADARTQETLAAVHETLERIVGRLTDIEKEQKHLAHRTGEMAEKLVEYTTATAAAAASVAQVDPATAGQAHPQAGDIAPAADPATLAPQMPADAPADNGAARQRFDPAEILAAARAMEGPDFAAAQSVSTASAPSPEGGAPATVSPGGATPEPTGMTSAAPGEQEDFIAAARRAAMAAAGRATPASEATDATAPDDKDGEDGPLASLLAGLRRRKGEKAGADANAAQDGGQAESGSRLGAVLTRLRPGKKNDEAAAPAATDDAAATDEGGTASRKSLPLIVAGLGLLVSVLTWSYGQYGSGGDTAASAGAPQAAVANTAAKDAIKNGAKNAGVTKGKPAARKRPPRAVRPGSQRHGALMRDDGGAPAQGDMPRYAALFTGDTTASGTTSAADATKARARMTADPIVTGSVSAVGSGPETAANAARATAADGGPRIEARAALKALPPQLGTPALRMAATNGDPKAAYVIGSLYLSGRDVPRNPARAADWFTRAAARGLVPAQYRLGTLYERGVGLRRDLDKARVWYERAARAGNVKAMHNLAVLLASAGDHADYARAARWFRAAAEHGLRDSQYNLAVLYQRGMGLSADPAEAYFWYGVAAARGDSDAAERQAALRASLDADARKRLDARIEAWKPKRPDIAANLVTIDKPEWRKGGLARAASAPAVGAKESAADRHILKDAESIRRIQTLLSRAGYDPGPLDGRMGSRTANAIRLFQLQMGMRVNGQPTESVLKTLEGRFGKAGAA